MDVRERIDPESREALDLLMAVMPGGLNAVADIVLRRQAVEAMAAEMSKALPPNDRVDVTDREVPGLDADPSIPVRIYRPIAAVGDLPAIVNIHGGGMIFGSLDVEHQSALALSEAVGCVVVSVGYRLAPEHPYPAAVRDCYAALRWTVEHADELSIDPSRLAVNGGSAGGGLALALALTARDQGGPSIRFVLASYPMIDDRSETPSSHEITDLGIWDRAANIEAWSWYLGGQDADGYAAPARADDLSGLPPTFIDVGDLDLFRDEDIAFAARLLQAGVPTELHVYPGAFHASEAFAPMAALSQRIIAARLDALRRHLA